MQPDIKQPGKKQPGKKRSGILHARREALARRLYMAARTRQMSIPQMLVDHAVFGLMRRLPQYSAVEVVSRFQLVFFILLVLVFASVLVINHFWLMIFSGVIFSAFYFCAIILRIAILPAFRLQKTPLNSSLEQLLGDPERCGTYSILVALYREGNQVEALVHSLARLKWPRGQSEILLVCEADDTETLGQLALLKLPNNFKLVKVPNSHPRTKPKALNYALTLASGDYVVIYDAEDRPNPLQLLEARFIFEQDDLYSNSRPLACLQAPLVIHNQNASWLTRLFSIEYATLFSVILPTFAYWGAPIPLGGTSNHFKTSILKKIGSWDPFNVTEDADLGIRLYRAGYACKTISKPTLEEAPDHWQGWLPQRTRWLKGWMQTLLVHLRSPVCCLRELGMRGSAIFLFFLLAIVISSLLHPMFTIISLYYLPGMLIAPVSEIEIYLGLLNAFVFIGGYCSYAGLVIINPNYHICKSSNWWLLLLPLYWMLISVAAWRALFQLFTRPHHWEKTDHVL